MQDTISRCAVVNKYAHAHARTHTHAHTHTHTHTHTFYASYTHQPMLASTPDLAYFVGANFSAACHC